MKKAAQECLVVASLLLSLEGCATINIPAAGPVPRVNICGVASDCGAGGVEPQILVGNDRTPREVQDVTDLLGQYINPQNPYEIVPPCGPPLNPSSYTKSPQGNIRIEAVSESEKSVKARASAELSKIVFGDAEISASAKAEIDALSTELSRSVQTYYTRTYTVKPGAVAAVRAACRDGDSETRRQVLSLVLVEASSGSKADAVRRVSAQLSAKVALKAAIGSADAGFEARVRDLAIQLVERSVTGFQFAIAAGYGPSSPSGGPETLTRVEAMAREGLLGVTELKKNLAQAGFVPLTADQSSRPLLDGSKCDNNPDNPRGIRRGRVEFARAFDVKPSVSLSLSFLDVSNSSNLRIRANVLEVDSKGFAYEFVTWCHTEVHGARLEWTALPRLPEDRN